jgi:hypothetical protein
MLIILFFFNVESQSKLIPLKRNSGNEDIQFMLKNVKDLSHDFNSILKYKAF